MLFFRMIWMGLEVSSKGKRKTKKMTVELSEKAKVEVRKRGGDYYSKYL